MAGAAPVNGTRRLHAEQRVEQQAGGVGDRADAGMRGVHRGGIRLNMADEFRQVVGRKPSSP
jgi:hypothetical protein